MMNLLDGMFPRNIAMEVASYYYPKSADDIYDETDIKANVVQNIKILLAVSKEYSLVISPGLGRLCAELVDPKKLKLSKTFFQKKEEKKKRYTKKKRYPGILESFEKILILKSHIETGKQSMLTLYFAESIKCSQCGQWGISLEDCIECWHFQQMCYNCCRKCL
jgi:hypothetical protein